MSKRVPIGKPFIGLEGDADKASSYDLDTIDNHFLSMKKLSRVSVSGHLRRVGTVSEVFGVPRTPICEKFLKVGTWGVDSTRPADVSSDSNGDHRKVFATRFPARP